MDDCQLRVGVRNEYRSNLASVVPSHRASVFPGKVFTLTLFSDWYNIGSHIRIHRE